MAHVVREVSKQTVVDNVEESPTTHHDEHVMTVVERAIYWVGGFIMAVIGLRIVLSLLGANRGNAFADLIYGISYPFVAPFFGLFNYKVQYGVSRFEFESFVALIVWGLVTLAIARLVTIGRNSEE